MGNMKKLLIGTALAVMLMSPTVAKADNDWVRPVIFGTIFGIIIANANNHHKHHHHHRYTHPPRYNWVEVCKTWPHTIQDHYGDYYTEMIYGCRMVKRASW